MADYATISIDKTTKGRAARRAKKDHMNISVVTRILLNDYADGKIVVGARAVRTENGFTSDFEDAVLAAQKEPSSPPFENAEDAILYLQKESKKAAS